MGNLFSIKRYGAVVRFDYSRQKIKYGGLSGTIRPHHAEDLTFFNIKGQIIHRRQSAETLSQIIYSQYLRHECVSR